MQNQQGALPGYAWGTGSNPPPLLQKFAKLLNVQSAWAVGMCAFLWFSATTWLYPLLLPDEGRYVGVAWGMLSSGDYAVPMLDGLPFFHKPPLFYWITALSLDLFGVNEWAARMASVLGASLTVGMAFWFIRAHAGQRIAILAALILLSCPLLFGASHYANLDMTVGGIITATVCVGAAAALRYEAGRRYRAMFALAYALAAAGFMAKGLIGIVLPGGVLFFWLLGRRRFDTMLRMIWLPGIILCLALSLPWMIAMQQRYPGFFDYYILYQHFYRYLEKGFNNARPFWFYVPVLLGLTLPWSLQIWRACRKAYWRQPQGRAVRGLMFAWLAVVLVFFSIPNSKLVGYILPALAPLAYFIAEGYALRMEGSGGSRAARTFIRSLYVSLGICILAVIVMTVWPQPGTKHLAKKMQHIYTHGEDIVMLERFRYDLDFYLHAGRPAAVVSNWNDPELPKTDNWRRELYDAIQFDQAAGARLLIDVDQLISRLCAPRHTGLWLLGDEESHDHYGFLQGMEAKLTDGRLRAWHIQPDEELSFCAGTPKGALK